MRTAPVLWRRSLHLLAGLVPLAYGAVRWGSPLSIHTLLIAGGLIYTVWVLVRRGHYAPYLGEFAQGAVTVIFLDLALRHVEPARLWEVLRSLDLGLLLWGMTTFAAGVWFRGYRWYFLLEEKGKVTVRDAVFTTYVAYFGNYALPARAGEVLRIVVLGERTGLSKTKITASVALEKLSDLLALVAIVVYLIGFTALAGPTLRWLAWTGGALALVLVGALLVIIVLRKQLPLSGEGSGAAGRFRRAIHNFVEGMRPASEPAHLGQFFLYSAISWVLIAYSCYAFLDAEGLVRWLEEASRVGPVASTLLLVILVNASTLIPAGPGSAGPYQAAVVLSFALLGTGAASAGTEAYHNAAAFSIVYWLGHAIPALAVGGLLFFRSGLTLQLLRSAEREATDRVIPKDNSVEGGSGEAIA
ncbi:MAG: lysylphosphatidylglycerol synthase transmembrane domain-containing protein [bacterium]